MAKPNLPILVLSLGAHPALGAWPWLQPVAPAPEKAEAGADLAALLATRRGLDTSKEIKGEWLRHLRHPPLANP
ncbi:MAG TPA: hypothetical protein VG734_00090 [Lacunisphaera sp.]|nr:hypothetical protein [Lacunisphaera sp.]